jgi:hypothetical protein
MRATNEQEKQWYKSIYSDLRPYFVYGKLSIDGDFMEKYGGKMDETFLHLSAKFGDLEWCKDLLSLGGNIDHKRSDGATALTIACELKQFDVAKYLIKVGANVNVALDTTKLTPLHMAASHQNLEMCELLLMYGANHKVKDWMGFQTYQYLEKEHFKAFRELRDKYSKPESNWSIPAILCKCGSGTAYEQCHGPQGGVKPKNVEVDDIIEIAEQIKLKLCQKLAEKGLIDKGFMFALQCCQFYPHPWDSIVPANERVRRCTVWNAAVDQYIERADELNDSRGPLEIQRMSKIDESGYALYKKCYQCEKIEEIPRQFKRCTGCKMALFCSVECQKQGWSSHKALCQANAVDKPLLQSQVNFDQFQARLQANAIRKTTTNIAKVAQV